MNTDDNSLMSQSTGANKWMIIYPLILAAGMVAVIFRCHHLQFDNVQQARQRAERQQEKIINFSQRRGDIVDSRLRKLAVSVKQPSVWIDPSFIRDDEDSDVETKQKEISIKLAAILDMKSREILKDLQARSDKQFMWIKRFISQDQAEKIEALDFPGVVISYEYKRHYPMAALAGHILGFTDIDGQGVGGVESQYNDDLIGQAGKLLSRADVSRRSVQVKAGSKLPVDGKTIVLTIDAEIQQFLETKLQEITQKYKAQCATGIVMDPATGDIWALANYPSFNPAGSKRNVALQRNIALTDTYEPGSTFKPFTVCAGIDSGVVSIDQIIDCTESGVYDGPGFRAVHEYGGHKYGMLSVAGIIIKSSNIGVAKIAQMMGPDKFYRSLELFGFGRKTGIDLPGEAAGLPRNKIIDGKLVTLSDQLKAAAGAPTTLTRVAFGQTIAVTPVQLITAFCSLANGGHPVIPRVLKEKIDCNVDDIQKSSWLAMISRKPNPAPIQRAGRIIEAKTARDIIEKGMVEVVGDEGTAQQAHLDKWTVFGKTGTANIARSDGRGYEAYKWVSSFIAGAPAENPRVVVLVVVRAPDRSLGLGYTGGVVAGPVVRDILEHTLTYLQVPAKVVPEVESIDAGGI
ncbi:MAG: penicillin-binding protein 2 [Phycisphaerae bacterium]|nr:penicillin-binding protein 2 [Phycisphaerae bacterium]